MALVTRLSRLPPPLNLLLHIFRRIWTGSLGQVERHEDAHHHRHRSRRADHRHRRAHRQGVSLNPPPTRSETDMRDLVGSTRRIDRSAFV